MENKATRKGRALQRMDILKRKSQFLFEEIVEGLYKDILEGDLSMEEVGTSEEEIERLRAENHRSRAEIWLKVLRSRVLSYEHTKEVREYLRSDIQKADCSFEDIGTTNQEMRKFIEDHPETS